MPRILFCGDRRWSDRSAIFVAMSRLVQELGQFVVVEGEASGADIMARQIAQSLGLSYLPFPAQWEKYGRAAGPIRNEQMLREGKPVLVMAFHEALQYSKGTKNMVEQSLKTGILVWTYEMGFDQLNEIISELKIRLGRQ